MTRDQLQQLRDLSSAIQLWIERGNHDDVPIGEISRLARLAMQAANVIEQTFNRGRT